MLTSPRNRDCSLRFSCEKGQRPFANAFVFVLQNDHFRFKNKWEGEVALPQYGTKSLLGNAIL